MTIFAQRWPLSKASSSASRSRPTTTANRLVAFVPQRAVLVFKALSIPQPEKGTVRSEARRRRLSQWQRRLIRTAAESKTQEVGTVVAELTLHGG